jgi:hypothetical protein
MSCSSAVQTLFNKNVHLVYYPSGLTGSSTLQTGFVQDANNASHFICTTPPLPSTLTYGLGQLSLVAGQNDIVAQLHGDVFIAYQSDSNIVVYGNAETSSSVVEWSSGHSVQACTDCHISFGADGNLATYQQNTILWSSGTSGVGHTLKCLNQAPWLQILDVSGKSVWAAVPTATIPTATIQVSLASSWSTILLCCGV